MRFKKLFSTICSATLLLSMFAPSYSAMKANEQKKVTKAMFKKCIVPHEFWSNDVYPAIEPATLRQIAGNLDGKVDNYVMWADPEKGDKDDYECVHNFGTDANQQYVNTLPFNRFLCLPLSLKGWDTKQAEYTKRAVGKFLEDCTGTINFDLERGDNFYILGLGPNDSYDKCQKTEQITAGIVEWFNDKKYIATPLAQKLRNEEIIDNHIVFLDKNSPEDIQNFTNFLAEHSVNIDTNATNTEENSEATATNTKENSEKDVKNKKSSTGKVLGACAVCGGGGFGLGILSDRFGPHLVNMLRKVIQKKKTTNPRAKKSTHQKTDINNSAAETIRKINR